MRDQQHPFGSEQCEDRIPSLGPVNISRDLYCWISILKIGLNFPDDTNLVRLRVRVDVKNESDKRSLPYTRLTPLVNAILTTKARIELSAGALR
jgi:hypothetical protein